MKSLAWKIGHDSETFYDSHSNSWTFCLRILKVTFKRYHCVECWSEEQIVARCVDQEMKRIDQQSNTPKDFCRAIGCN
jgi:hypothetical protein